MTPSKRTQKRPGKTVRTAVKTAGSGADEMLARATQSRVAVLEALERAGGNIRDVTYGVCPRIVRMGGPRLERASTVYQCLRGMETLGWVVLDEVPMGEVAGRDAYRIVEVQLIEIPGHFVGPIAELRKKRGIKHFDPEDPAVELAVARRAEERVATAVMEAALSISGTDTGNAAITGASALADTVVGQVQEELVDLLRAQNQQLAAEVDRLTIDNDALRALVKEMRDGSRV